MHAPETVDPPCVLVVEQNAIIGLSLAEDLEDQGYVVVGPLACLAALKWLQTRAFRSGQTYGLLRLSKGDGRFKVAALSMAKVTVYLAKMGLTFWSPVGWRKASVRVHLHGGILAAAMGKAPVELYGAAHA